MTIETKFNYKETVWAMFSDTPTEFYITGIRAYLKNSGQDIEIQYDIQTSGGTVASRLEKMLFSTKKELIESL
jgi:hypothetical protein